MRTKAYLNPRPLSVTSFPILLCKSLELLWIHPCLLLLTIPHLLILICMQSVVLKISLQPHTLLHVHVVVKRLLQKQTLLLMITKIRLLQFLGHPVTIQALQLVWIYVCHADFQQEIHIQWCQHNLISNHNTLIASFFVC